MTGPIIKYTDGTDLEEARLNRYPDMCPACETGIETIFHVAELSERYNLLQAVFQCPRSTCRAFIIAFYEFSRPAHRWNLRSVVPFLKLQQEYSEEIKNLSPNFVNIYNQAFAAEQTGLDQICGPGYRKALEFLTKDFACSEHPNDIDAIKRTQLVSCIKQYITDSRIQSTAERAAWLGNDETHYVRKFANQDIQDLKILFRLTVNWVENALLTKMYISNMPKT